MKENNLSKQLSEERVTTVFDYKGAKRTVQAYGKTYTLPIKTASIMDKISKISSEVNENKDNITLVISTIRKGISYFIGADEVEQLYPEATLNEADIEEIASFWIFLNKVYKGNNF